jgi:hypothetical protein
MRGQAHRDMKLSNQKRGAPTVSRSRTSNESAVLSFVGEDYHFGTMTRRAKSGNKDVMTLVSADHRKSSREKKVLERARPDRESGSSQSLVSLRKRKKTEHGGAFVILAYDEGRKTALWAT